jgi:hypothetical protein
MTKITGYVNVTIGLRERFAHGGISVSKPPWVAHKQHEAQAMHDWVNAMLDEEELALCDRANAMLDAESPEYSPEYTERGSKWFKKGGPERDLAEAGFIEPARELIRRQYPYLADLVQAPKRKRGQYPRVSLRRDQRVSPAAEDVGSIQTLWQRPPPYGYGKKNRRKGCGPTAIEIAARRHGVDPEEVATYLKKHGVELKEMATYRKKFLHPK